MGEPKQLLTFEGETLLRRVVRAALETNQRPVVVVLGAHADAMQEEIKDDEFKPLFIPFPGTAKQLQPKPYQGSGPEWQEFIRLSKDRAQMDQIRG